MLSCKEEELFYIFVYDMGLHAKIYGRNSCLVYVWCPFSTYLGTWGLLKYCVPECKCIIRDTK